MPPGSREEGASGFFPLQACSTPLAVLLAEPNSKQAGKTGMGMAQVTCTRVDLELRGNGLVTGTTMLWQLGQVHFIGFVSAFLAPCPHLFTLAS